MRNTLEKVMERWGTSMSLLRQGKETPLKGFLQETGSRNWQNMEKVFTPLGEIPRGQYLYLGPLEPRVNVGDVLLQGNRIFEVRRAEAVYCGDGPVYCWGLCVEKGGEDTWGSPL